MHIANSTAAMRKPGGAVDGGDLGAAVNKGKSGRIGAKLALTLVVIDVAHITFAAVITALACLAFWTGLKFAKT